MTSRVKIVSTRAESVIETVLKRFYFDHHDSEQFKQELIGEVKASRVRAFFEAKRVMLDALEHRLAEHEATRTLIKINNPVHGSGYIDDLGSKMEELSTILYFVKGMVVKTDEDLNEKS